MFNFYIKANNNLKNLKKSEKSKKSKKKEDYEKKICVMLFFCVFRIF